MHSSTRADSTTQPTTQPSNLLSDIKDYTIELEKGGDVTIKDHVMIIDVPAGCTVWYNKLLESPTQIEYETRVILNNGKNDRLSDVNCFWMARDARGPDSLDQHKRTGQFADYNQLKGYYVGYGGNGNTTTRFRRYIGDKELRPLLPEHDLKDGKYLLKPNEWMKIRIIANGSLIQYFRNDEKVFEMNDSEPYTSGWFGFRTVTSHQEIRNFKITSSK